MKIIASDYDGTLYYDDKASDGDREAIKQFRAIGNKFGIVTSRDLYAASYIKPSIETEIDFLICSTGAIILDGQGNITYHKKSKRTDIPMVRALNGFSVENSCDELKSVAKNHAKRVCDMIDKILENEI